MTEQVISDMAKYESDYAPKARKSILDHKGRFIARTNDVTVVEGDAPKRVVILGFESMDEMKAWRNSREFTELKPLRDQVMKARSYAVFTCENPQGAKPGQYKC